MNFERTKVLLVLFLFLGSVSIASAQSNFQINAVDEPFSLNQTGFNTSTVQVVQLLYDNPSSSSPAMLPITPQNLNPGSTTNYFYNKSMGNATELEYLGKNYNGTGYWYAKFKPNRTRGDMIKYNTSGSVNHSVSKDVYAEETANLTEDLNVGDLKLDFVGSVKDKYNAGRNDVKINVQVQNASTGEYVTDNTGSVTVFFANASGRVTSTALDNYNSNENYFYNSEVSIPASTNSTYIMQVKATNSSGRRPYGTTSEIVQTYPAIHGKVTGFSASGGCKDSSMVQTCEQGAEIDIKYRITAASANSVNLTTYAFNESGRHELMNMSLSRDDNVFTGSMEVPDLNTSKYKNKIEFVFNATNAERTHVDRRNVTLEYFSFEDRSDPTAILGNDYRLKLFLSKPFSRDPYNLSRFTELEVNVTDSKGNSVVNLTESDFTYRATDGLTMATFTLASTMPAGSYSVEGMATNIYNETRTLDSGFSVKDVNATFDFSDTEFAVDTLWSQNFTAGIENLISQTNELTITRDLPQEVMLWNDTIVLEPDENDFLKFGVNLTAMNDTSGELTLADNQTGFNKTVDISVDAADCEKVSGRICSKESSIDAYIGNISINRLETVELVNIGPPGETIQYNASMTGDITPYADIVGETKNLNVTDRNTVQVNFTAATSGNFTGKLVLNTENDNTLKVNISLEANVSDSTGDEDNGGNTGENKNTGSISVSPTSIDLGAFPSGESKTATVTLTNNLESSISEVSVASTTFTVSKSGFSKVKTGKSEEFTLQFEEVSSTSGTVAVSAGGKTREISVSAEPVKDYSQVAENQLRPRLQNLESKVKDSDLQSDLTMVSTKISKIKTAWASGNYEKAKRLYNEADSTLSRISNKVNSEPGNTNNQSSGGGIPVLPIAIAVILLAVIGFVFYTSYVPEEGDPLYSVMGEQQ